MGYEWLLYLLLLNLTCGICFNRRPSASEAKTSKKEAESAKSVSCPTVGPSLREFLTNDYCRNILMVLSVYSLARKLALLKASHALL